MESPTALVVTDSTFSLKSNKSGRSVVGEVQEDFRRRCHLRVQFNEDRHGKQFRFGLLDDLRKHTLSERHSFVWIISLGNDLFDNTCKVVWDRDGIKNAGREYKELLQGKDHVIVFGGRGDLWNIDDYYDEASKGSVRDLRQLGLNVVWGGDLMRNWSPQYFKNWHWAGSSRDQAAHCLITLMTEARASTTPPPSPPPAPAISPPLPAPAPPPPPAPATHHQPNRDHQGPPAQPQPPQSSQSSCGQPDTMNHSKKNSSTGCMEQKARTVLMLLQRYGLSHQKEDQ